MSSQKIKFRDKEIDNKKFYSSKEAILLDSVDLSKIVVSSRWKLSDKTYKYFCRYLNNVIKPLCVVLPQMSRYIKYLIVMEKMSFVTDDKEVYEKYNEIWNVVKRLLKLEFTASPIRDDKYILAKLKIFKKKNLTTFNNNNIIPMEKNHYICIPAIDIDSVLKIDKKAYQQAYLEQCKYKLKKRKLVTFIDDKIIDDDSDEDNGYDSDNENHF